MLSVNFNERLRKLIYHYSGGNQREFSRKTGVSVHIISKSLNEGQIPSVAIATKIALAFPDLNCRWLLTGKEEMIFISNEELLARIQALKNTLAKF